MTGVISILHEATRKLFQYNSSEVMVTMMMLFFFEYLCILEKTEQKKSIVLYLFSYSVVRQFVPWMYVIVNVVCRGTVGILIKKNVFVLHFTI